MADIRPFKAIRPARDKIAFVASRSYQEYPRQELQAELTFNPFSFLHIINPGYKFHKKVSGRERFQLVHNRYLEFLEEGTLIKDIDDSFYLYEIEKGDFRCSGLFCATSVADYRKDVIKKHEATLQQREMLFADYLDTVRFNAEPVLMTYPEDRVISEALEAGRRNDPEYFFTTKDRTTHRVWVISEKKAVRKLIGAFGSLPSLYIADGHHRSASSDLLAERLEKRNAVHTGNEAYNFFMSYLIPETDVKIYEFNRMVKDLNGLSKERFLMALDEFYRIETQGRILYKPTKKHHFGMYLDGEFYSLYLRKKVYTFTDPLSRLDTQILFKTILQPILDIHDLRTDKRIAYGYGKHNVIKMKDDIDNGHFAVGFSLVPITIEEIKNIANAGLVMPPKSTYIEPKLRSGITIYEL